MSQLIYRWQQTPAELFAHSLFRGASGAKVHGETKPFTSKPRALEGTELFFQLGISRTAKGPDIEPIQKEAPHLPDSGDYRSGVLLLDRFQRRAIGCFVADGRRDDNPMRTVFLDEDFRGRGLATKMVEMFLREIPGIKDHSRLIINFEATKVFLAAHVKAVEWAKASGKSVPVKVLAALGSGVEAKAILEKAARA